MKEMNKYKWSMIERFLPLIIQLVSLSIISRYTQPKDFGDIGVLSIFITISQVFIDGGLSSYLIKKNKPSENELSTVFFSSLFVGVMLYFILFIISGDIADFYDNNGLKYLLIYIAISIVFSAIAVVPRALLTINQDFKRQSKASLYAALFSNTISIYLAYLGFGVWAIASQTVIFNIINAILICLVASWIPKRLFSISSLKVMLPYSYKVMIITLLENVYRNVFLNFLGKYNNTNVVGLYYQAQKFTELPSSNLATVIQRVSFSSLTKIEDEDLRINKANVFILSTGVGVFYLFTLITIFSNNIVIILLGERWVEVSLIIKVLSISAMILPVKMSITNIFFIKERPDIVLKLDFFSKLGSITFIILALKFSFVTALFTILITSLLSLFVLLYLERIYLKYIKTKTLFSIVSFYSFSFVIFLLSYIYTDNIVMVFSLFSFTSIFYMLALMLNIRNRKKSNV
ncbi:TPA: lipopolysaccharide biosynthesis protein [Photobacterium damselae]